eukprot:5993353-Pleurochrysis_carterae.AAC.1
MLRAHQSESRGCDSAWPLAMTSSFEQIHFVYGVLRIASQILINGNFAISVLSFHDRGLDALNAASAVWKATYSELAGDTFKVPLSPLCAERGEWRVN